MARLPQALFVFLICASLIGCSGDEGGSAEATDTQTADAPDTSAEDTRTPPDTTPPDTSERDTSQQDTHEPDAAEDTTLPDTTPGDITPPDTTPGDTTPGDTTPPGDADGGGQDMDVMDPGNTPWAWCPTASDYVGDSSWPLHIQVTEDALYCGLHDERFVDWATMPPAVLWRDQQANKGQLSIPPGDYALPSAEGSYAFTLPMCFLFFEENTQPLLDGPGTLTVTRSDFGGETTLNYQYTQPLSTAGGESWQYQAWFGGPEPAPGTGLALTLDGSPFDVFGQSQLSFSASICAPDCNTGLYRGFDSCHFDPFDTRHHEVDFMGGTVAFDLRYGESFASTEPGAFVRAVGDFDGQAFDATDYWDLIYTPEHHHFARYFMVLLDPPVGSVCALAGEHLDEDTTMGGFGPDPEIVLYDCDLNEVGTRTITGERFERVAP